MRSHIRRLLIAASVLLLAVPFVSAAQAGSIVDTAVADGRFTTLVAAVKAAGLVEPLSGGTWTVFAPTDAAFAKLGLNADNIGRAFTKEQLTDILLYHALPVAVTSADAIVLQGDITMANGQRAGLKYFEGDLYVNDDAKVIIADLLTSNGVIHVVDTVILGPWPKDATLAAEMQPTGSVGNSIVDIAVADGRFTTLVAAVKAAGLVEPLSGGEWTVFAPTDAAFAKLGLNAANIANTLTKAQLTDILLYHALPAGVTSDIAKADQGDTRMANGELAGIKYFEGDLYVNDDAKVIIPNILASNGVIHVADAVILGPWPR